MLRIKQIPGTGGGYTPRCCPMLSEQFGRKATADYNKTLRLAFGLSWLTVIPSRSSNPILTYVLPYGKEFVGSERAGAMGHAARSAHRALSPLQELLVWDGCGSRWFKSQLGVLLLTVAVCGAGVGATAWPPRLRSVIC